MLILFSFETSTSFSISSQLHVLFCLSQYVFTQPSYPGISMSLMHFSSQLSSEEELHLIPLWWWEGWAWMTPLCAARNVSWEGNSQKNQQDAWEGPHPQRDTPSESHTELWMLGRHWCPSSLGLGLTAFPEAGVALHPLIDPQISAYHLHLGRKPEPTGVNGLSVMRNYPVWGHLQHPLAPCLE